MKPLLVIGVGNPLMGDDGVGRVVAEWLAGDPRLPADAEVICGGSDLLRYAGQMEGRSRVVVIDAVQSDLEPGSIVLVGGTASGVDERQNHAHQLSAVQAIRLLEMLGPIRWTLFGIAISAATLGTSLSPALNARMPAILDRVLQELAADCQTTSGSRLQPLAGQISQAPTSFGRRGKVAWNHAG